MNCQHCGAKFSGHKRKYCTPACRDERNRAYWRGKNEAQKAERKADRPWTLRSILVCWLERECVACGQQKPRSAYRPRLGGKPGSRGYSPDGLQSACRECESRRRACAWLFAATEQRLKKSESLRKWRGSEAGKAYRARQFKDPDHEKSYRRKRLERLARQDDGTVTSAVLRAEFARTHCLYCANPMQTKDKQLDHMHPLALGGLHSASNVLVCCASCNGRKSHLSYPDWLSTLKPEQQAVCRALWVKRYGAPPEQVPMLLPDPGTVMRKVESLKQRDTREAIAEAKRARAAWFKHDAPDEWMAAYWEGMGEPWRNRRLSDGERYRLQYQHDPVYRAKEIERQRVYKQRTTRTWEGGAYKVVGRRCGRGGSKRVA